MTPEPPGGAGVSPACPRGWHSRGYLPHFDGGEIPQAITFRLADSLPEGFISRLEIETKALPEDEAAVRRRKRIDDALDAGRGDAWLRDPRIAGLVEDALLHFDGQRYRLHAWVIMPNHVHAIITPLPGHSVSAVLHSWKSYTAKMANRLLGRSGEFWQMDYFDRFIRDARHYEAAVRYVDENPVKAGLCTKKEQWVYGSARRNTQEG